MAVLCAGLLAACGPDYFEIPIETPIQPKLDVSAFQRVLVAGFVAGGTDDVDANQETVRLLRSQLRTKSSLQRDRRRRDAADRDRAGSEQGGRGRRAAMRRPARQRRRREQATRRAWPLPKNIKEEKDLEPYERLFANTAYWKNDRRGISEPADRHGHGALHAEGLLRPGQPRAGGLRQLRPAARRPGPRHTWSGKASSCSPSSSSSTGAPARRCIPEGYREEVLYNVAAAHAGAVVVLRAHGPHGPDVPEHAQQPERSRARGFC